MLFLLAVFIGICNAVDKEVKGPIKLEERITLELPLTGLPFENQNLSASELYDPNTQKCCKGSVHPSVGRFSPDRCCDTKSINPSKQLCCNGHVNDFQVGHYCCGNTTYNTDDEICCFGSPQPITSEIRPYSECCDTSIIDTRTQLCCYSNGRYTPVDTNDPTDQCCGIKAYNEETAVCCISYSSTTRDTSTNVIPKTGNKTLCCGGTKLFDAATEICCESETYPSNRNTSCCGNITINSQSQICCRNLIYTSETVIHDRQNNTQCCGAELYNPIVQSCCNYSIIDGRGFCCGNSIYDSDTQLCCYTEGQRVVVDKNSGEDSCCGLRAYDNAKSVCCFNNDSYTVLDKTNPKDNICCGNKTIQYGNEICCQSGNPLVQPVQPLGFYNRSCCGDQSYDTTTQECCGTTVLNRTYAEGLFCCRNKVPYNYMTEACCFDDSKTPVEVAIYPLGSADNCCGTKRFNYTSYNRCCKNEPRQVGQNETCCGNQVYNYLTHVCCGENVIEMKENQTQCCYYSRSDEYDECSALIEPVFSQYFVWLLSQLGYL